MEPQHFDALLERLRHAARRRPGVFRLKTALLAALGYAYILAILSLILLAGFILPLFLLVPALILVYLILRALWVRVYPPPGLALDRPDAARLYRELDALRAKLYIPAFDCIQLDGSFNAAVNQIPRLGILGWNRSYLTIGLPLLLGLSPQQFRCVLAHEMCHLFGGHSRFGTWLYRAGESWNRLMQGFEARDSRADALFRAFFRWYVPRLNAHTLALAQVNELDCDRFAADLMGSRDKADALIWVRLKGRYYDTVFWDEIWKTCESSPEPPANSFSTLREAIRVHPEGEIAVKWLDEALVEVVPAEEVHPSLSDRLKSLGEAPRVPPPLEETAAEFFLRDHLDRYLENFSADWREKATPNWTERHDHIHKARQRLAALHQKSADTLSPQEAWEAAHLTEDLHGSARALPLYRQMTGHDEFGPHARFAVGRILLEEHPSEAIPLIEQAMDAHFEYILDGCGRIYQRLLAAGNRQEAQKYFTRARRHQEVLSLAERERTRIGPRDRFLSHDVPPEDVETIVRCVSAIPELSRAWLVRKEVKHLPQRPCHILAVIWRFTILFPNELALLSRIATELAQLPSALYIFSVQSDHRLRNRIQSVPRAEIYRRPWFASLRKRASQETV